MEKAHKDLGKYVYLVSRGIRPAEQLPLNHPSIELLAEAVKMALAKVSNVFPIVDYEGLVKEDARILRDLLEIFPSLGLLYYNPSEALDAINSGKSQLKGVFGKELVAIERLLRKADKALKELPTNFEKEQASIQLSEQKNLLDRYFVQPFVVEVFHEKKLAEPVYISKLAKYAYRFLITDISMAVSKLLPKQKPTSFSRVYDRAYAWSMSFLRRNYHLLLRLDEMRGISHVSTLKMLRMSKLAPFLLDDAIDEFYLDAPNTPIYLDHRDWGRCTSNVSLKPRHVEYVATHLRRRSGLRLDWDNPSIKADLVTNRFHVRVSVDSAPLAVDGYALDVRRLRKKPFTIADLVRNETLSSEAAAYVLFCLMRRRNITILGETGSGKTTLLNALDLCAPRFWRKIYVEDVVESVSQLRRGRHQLRLFVEPFEATNPRRRKSVEIVKLLHRNPDYVVLSELQTEEHSKAFFFALAAGIRGMQTIHADSVDRLVRRWVFHHGINPECLNDLDLLITMSKFYLGSKTLRKLTSICEIEEVDPLRKTAKISHTFKWCANEFQAKKNTDLFETPVIHKIRKREGLTRREFFEELAKYQRAVEVAASGVCREPLQSLLERELLGKWR